MVLHTKKTICTSFTLQLCARNTLMRFLVVSYVKLLLFDFQKTGRSSFYFAEMRLQKKDEEQSNGHYLRANKIGQKISYSNYLE